MPAALATSLIEAGFFKGVEAILLKRFKYYRIQVRCQGMLAAVDDNEHLVYATY
jgi:hypothetical protein